MGLFEVYIHKTPNNKVYIGITGKEPNKRWKNGKGYLYNKHFTNAIKKFGWDNIEHIIVKSQLTKEEAASLEKALIEKYRANDPEHGYNRSSGGEFPSEGTKWTDEMKKRNSQSHIGKKNTKEHNLNISKGKKGKPNGKEGMVGELCPRSGIVKQIDEKTGETVAIFHGFPEARRKTGFALTPMKEAAYGIRKRAYGYLWEYEGVPNVIV